MEPLSEEEFQEKCLLSELAISLKDPAYRAFFLEMARGMDDRMARCTAELAHVLELLEQRTEELAHVRELLERLQRQAPDPED